MAEGEIAVTKVTPSLTATTVRSFLWAFSGGGFQAILKIVVVAVLARLLAPADFGVVSAALTVVALAELFGRIGVAPALVQAPTLDPRTIRTASTVTLTTGLLAGLTLFLLAPVVAQLFQMPAMEPVVRGFSAVFVITAFSIVPEALMQRAMRFRDIALVLAASHLFGYALVAITLSMMGFGYWALVWGHVAQQALASTAYIALIRPQMRPLIDRGALVHLFRFGAGVTLARIGNYVAMNADYFIVGRWLGADALGYYSRAYLLLMQPTQLVGTMASTVLYPALSSVQGDEKRLLRGYYRAMSLVFLTSAPLTAVLWVLAPEIIGLLMGPQWDLAVLPFQILVVALVFRTAYKLMSALLRARAAVFLLALWQWVYAGLVIAGAFVGMQWDMPGVAAGVSVAILATFWIGAWFGGIAAPTRISAHLAIFARYGVLGLLVYAPLAVLRAFMVAAGLHSVLVVAGCLALAAAIFLATWLLLPKLFGEEGVWLRTTIGSRLPRLLRRS